MKKIIRVLVGLTVLGGLLAFAPSAKADAATTCTVTGNVTLSPAVTATPGPGGTFQFNSTSIDCVGAHAGTWDVESTGTRDAGETCAAAQGSGTLTATNRATGERISGSFDYARVGVAVTVIGSGTDGSGVAHDLAAELAFLADQNCAVDGTTSAVLTGAAAIV